MTSRYSDILTSFDTHPKTEDLGRITNMEAVKRSIRNLIMTDKYERRLNPSIGCNIRTLLFEPMDSATPILLRDYIEETLLNYEPRAFVELIVVEPDYERQTYYVTIKFRVLNVKEPASLEFYLDKRLLGKPSGAKLPPPTTSAGGSTGGGGSAAVGAIIKTEFIDALEVGSQIISGDLVIPQVDTVEYDYVEGLDTTSAIIAGSTFDLTSFIEGLETTTSIISGELSIPLINYQFTEGLDTTSAIIAGSTFDLTTFIEGLETTSQIVSGGVVEYGFFFATPPTFASMTNNQLQSFNVTTVVTFASMTNNVVQVTLYSPTWTNHQYVVPVTLYSPTWTNHQYVVPVTLYSV